MFDELRVALRVLTMIFVGYAVAIYMVSDRLYSWLSVRPPDPLHWLGVTVAHLL